jgi:hypothetical protein
MPSLRGAEYFAPSLSLLGFLFLWGASKSTRELMIPVLGDDRVNKLFDSIRNLEAVSDISKLQPLLMKI